MTNKVEVLGHLLIEGIMLAVNLVLIAALTIQLQVPPVSVTRAVETAQSTIELQIEEMKIQQDINTEALRVRGEWMLKTQQQNEYQIACWKALAEVLPELELPQYTEINLITSVP